jgi:hypothetical protein
VITGYFYEGNKYWYRSEMHTTLQSEKTQRKSTLENLGAGGKTILKVV